MTKCLTTGKWFCNGRVHGTGSCVILHLVSGWAGGCAGGRGGAGQGIAARGDVQQLQPVHCQACMHARMHAHMHAFARVSLVTNPGGPLQLEL